VPTAERDSIPFDRAADYYDKTRGFTQEGERRTIELLRHELDGRGRVLEIGVGTGQLALPLRAAGIDVVGLDLSMPMLAGASAKPGGVELPLVQGDATELPFAEGGFGAAYFRWVFHLIPRWGWAARELVRAVADGGVILASQGGHGGPRREIQRHFAALAGVSGAPAGLAWHDWPQLDATMARLGARSRALPRYQETERDPLPAFVDALEAGQYSWTWSLSEDVRRRAAEGTRAWAERRFGPLADVPPHTFDVVWRAYDLP
jgi:SAM-dependent methyltransferase